jgi:ankyrin repeat protein
MRTPHEIARAAHDGDTQTVVRFLDEGGDVNGLDRVPRGATLLLTSAACSHVELCRVLVARGADPNIFHTTRSPLRLAVYVAHGGLHRPPQGGGAAWSASPSGQICQILIESGADVNVCETFPFPDHTYYNPTAGMSVYGNDAFGSLLARLLSSFGKWDNSLSLEMVTTLLRGGARLESILKNLVSGLTYSASWCLEQALAYRPELAQDEYFIRTKELIVGVQEDGSFKRYVRRPHRAVLRLRSLFSRGRATPPCAIRCRRLRCYGAARQDYAMEFLVKQPDNGIVWNILSFWRASE